jgi:mRNA interferase MazF
VIQNDIGNQRSRTTIVAAITSKFPEHRASHVVIVEPPEAGLRERSAIMLSQIRTIDQSRLEEFCGALSSRRMIEVDQALRASLALD